MEALGARTSCLVFAISSAQPIEFALAGRRRAQVIQR